MSRRRLPPPRVEVVADAEELARRAADRVVASLGGALERRPVARWVLAGGSTPRRLYELLARRPRALDWRRIELYWGDERCLPPTAAASNFRLVRETLLAGLPLVGRRVHRIRGELPPAEAASRYDREVRAALAAGPFDLVLLGVGGDGHVASLFPGQPPAPARLAVAVEAPVEPRQRVTLTAEALAQTRRLIFLVAGAGKAAAVARALEPAPAARPISDLVQPPDGDTLWLLDRAAAAERPDSALW